MANLRPKHVVIAFIVLLVIIQLVPVWLFQTNPPVTAEPNWDSPETRALAQRACFNCHSNETNWAFYTKIAPISWLTTLDVIRGRRHLNFSEWTGNQTRADMGREAAQQIASGNMPEYYYLWIHPEARLTEAEKQKLIDGLQKSLQPAR